MGVGSAKEVMGLTTCRGRTVNVWGALRVQTGVVRLPWQRRERRQGGRLGRRAEWGDDVEV